MTKKKKRWFIILGCLLLVLLWIYWGNTSIQITRYSIASDRIPEAFSDYKIVQVSDLHNAEFGEKQGRLLKMINKTEPDIIVVTGDAIDSSHTNVDLAMEFIEGAGKLAPVYYVTGNHEAWTWDYEELRMRMEQAGVVVLDGKKVELIRDGEKIELLGVDDPAVAPSIYNEDTDETRIDNKLKELLGDNELFHILLSHRPELFDIYIQNKVELVLTGHAHGGQFRIPFIGGVVAPDQGFFPKYTAGMHEKDGTTMIVSRGLGNSIIPVRINNRPELVVVTLQKK